MLIQKLGRLIKSCLLSSSCSSHLLGVGLNSTLHDNNYRVEESCLHPKILRICFSSSCSSHLLGARTAVENKIKFGVGLNSSFHKNNYQTVWLILKKREVNLKFWSLEFELNVCRVQTCQNFFITGHL